MKLNNIFHPATVSRFHRAGFSALLNKIVLTTRILLLGGIPVPQLLANDFSASPQVLVAIHPDQPGAEIPADFLGLSYEKSTLAETHFRPDNAELINLFRNLGPGVLRFGGNHVELTDWQRNDSPGQKKSDKKAKLCLGPVALDNLYAFAKQIGWRIIHGLNLAGNNPNMAADEAAYALKIGGPTVLAFEVGNEPDYYIRHNLRPAGYGYSEYRGEAAAEQNAILAVAPNAPLAGPATTKMSDWFASFVADFKGRIVLATSHFYSLSAKALDPHSATFPTVENLLSNSTKKTWRSVIGERQNVASAAGISFRLGECNTASNGGKDGVSDVFASALWGADFLFDAAELGVAGINFHSGFGEHGYTPFSFHGQHYHPHPLYYSMLLFHQVAAGRVVPVDCQTSANVTVHAVLGDDGKLRVVLINKDLAQPVAVSIVPGSTRSTAEVIRLTAPSVNARDGVTLAGSAVSEDGAWTPKTSEPVSPVNGSFEVRLPEGSAALVTFE